MGKIKIQMRTIAKITFACLLAAVVRSDQPTKFLNEKNEPAYPAGYGGKAALDLPGLGEKSNALKALRRKILTREKCTLNLVRSVVVGTPLPAVIFVLKVMELPGAMGTVNGSQKHVCLKLLLQSSKID